MKVGPFSAFEEYARGKRSKTLKKLYPVAYMSVNHRSKNETTTTSEYLFDPGKSPLPLLWIQIQI
jgi:hypothetical protein